MKRNCGYVLADKVCPVCFTLDGHEDSCPRKHQPETVKAIIDRLPDLTQSQGSQMKTNALPISVTGALSTYTLSDARGVKVPISVRSDVEDDALAKAVLEVLAVPPYPK